MCQTPGSDYCGGRGVVLYGGKAFTAWGEEGERKGEREMGREREREREREVME